MDEAVKVTADEFISFLVEKCSGSKCAGCGGESFKTISSAEHGAWLFSVDTTNAPGFHLPTYAINCANCGWVRHHVAFRVEDWVKEQREKQTKLSPEAGSDD